MIKVGADPYDLALYAGYRAAKKGVKGVAKDVIGAEPAGAVQGILTEGRGWRRSVRESSATRSAAPRRAYGRDSFERGQDSEGRFQVSARDRNRETVERAKALVPAGEVLRGWHGVSLAERAPRPGYFRRPRALRSERRTLGSWLMLPVNGAARLYTTTWNPFMAFFEAVFWREAKKPGKPFHGGWSSMTGTWPAPYCLGPRTARP